MNILSTNPADVDYRHTHLYDVYKVRYGIEDQNPDTYLLDASQKALIRFAKENKANQPFLGVIKSEKDFNNVIEICGHTPDDVEQILEKKALENGYFLKEGYLLKNNAV